MRICEEKRGGRECLAVYDVGAYSLSDTLDCGQCFRFDRREQSIEGLLCEYEGVALGFYVDVAQASTGELLFFDTDEKLFTEVWESYFALDLPLEEIKADILKNAPKGNKLYDAAEYSGGIAILRQNAWEALFSFIVSQNNNIPRIKKIIRKICELYGNKTQADGHYAFPSALQVLENPKPLEEARTGFRYRYLLDAARAVCEGEILLDALKDAERSVIKTELLKITGVGEKVANCVMLFGLNCLDAFPIDVWIKRAMGEYFTDDFTVESLGKYAGVAQQYIFHYARKEQK